MRKQGYTYNPDSAASEAASRSFGGPLAPGGGIGAPPSAPSGGTTTTGSSTTTSSGGTSGLEVGGTMGGFESGFDSVSDFPDWMQEQDMHELENEYAGIDQYFRIGPMVKPIRQLANAQYSNALQQGANAADESIARAFQTGVVGPINTSMISAQTAMPALLAKLGAEKDIAGLRINNMYKEQEARAALASQIATMRQSYVNTMAQYALGQDQLSLQSSLGFANLAQDQEQLDFAQQQYSDQQNSGTSYDELATIMASYNAASGSPQATSFWQQFGAGLGSFGSSDVGISFGGATNPGGQTSGMAAAPTPRGDPYALSPYGSNPDWYAGYRQFNKFDNMATRQQALMIARQQKAEEQKQRIMAALISGELPMELIMDKRLPLTDQERQNMWNQRAADQYSARRLGAPSSVSSGKEVDPAIASLVSRYGNADGPISGSQNQIGQSISQLQRQPEWQSLDDKGQVAALQRIYGNDVATQYANTILDQQTVANQRRKTFDDQYDTQRAMDREQRQAAARLASTEPEMLHRGLMSRDIVVRPEGIMERNPSYNASNPLNQEPQYVAAGPAMEANVARNWGSVMPGRANPLPKETLMRIQVAEENPTLSAEAIAREAQTRLTNLLTAQQRGMSVDDLEARKRLAMYQGPKPAPVGPPQVFPQPNWPMRSMPGRSATPPSRAPAPMSAVAGATPPRFGQKLGMFADAVNPMLRYANPLTSAAAVVPYAEAQLTNIGRAVESNPTFGADQFIMDMLQGQQSQVIPRPAPVPLLRPEETSTFNMFPDWLK